MSVDVLDGLLAGGIFLLAVLVSRRIGPQTFWGRSSWSLALACAAAVAILEGWAG